MRIVLGQLTPTIGALDDNMAALTLAIGQAKAQGRIWLSSAKW
ncbi:MAG: hypothetical protein R2857_01520 [Vampirovibrionales bacterium]